MGSKKKLNNKSDKGFTPKEAPKSIDWSKQPEKDVVIVLKGKEVKCGKPSAIILVEAGKAKLK